MIALLVPVGAGITLVGIAGLVWCVISANGVRKAQLSDEEAKARLGRLVAVNLGSLAVAGIGLMCLVTGLFLG